eukprot:COSAG01_NODE_51744_length_352_cov_0.865613_1_plen_36_part_10
MYNMFMGVYSTTVRPCAETDLSDAYQHASREEMLVK